MAFINQLAKHKIVEVGNLVGLRSGHMVAQAPYRQVATETFLDNGHILFLDDAGELVLSNAAGAMLQQPFLHYTEELMSGPVYGLEYFTVDMDQELGGDPVCYPRAIALYEGDSFSTSNFATALTLAVNTKYFGILVAGVLTIVAAIPTTVYEGPLFVAYKDTMPAGQPGVSLTLINRHLVVTV